MNTLTKYKPWSWLLLLLPIYVFLFLKLGNFHVQLWDEGWFTVHAVEMHQQGSWLVTYFDGKPSLTSTKPPLQTWMQIGFIELLGISELAVRLPSAIAAAITVLLLFFFTRKHLNHGIAFMASLILLTSNGFVHFHTARGAEADALITLSLMIQAFLCFNYVRTRKANYLLLLLMMIGVGFWVKSVATFLFIPGMLAYVLIFDWKLIPESLKKYQFYLGLLICVGLIFGYVFIRDAYQPGYLDVVLQSNAKRYVHDFGHKNTWIYYIENFMRGRLFWWLPFTVIGMVMAFFKRFKKNDWVTFSTIVALAYLAMVTGSKNKLAWYDMPFYPLAAVVSASVIYYFLEPMKSKLKAATLIALFIFPLYQMFEKSQSNRLTLQAMEHDAQEIYLHQASKQEKNVDGLTVVHDHFNGAILFYKHKFAAAGQEIHMQNNLEGLGAGDRALILSEDFKEELLQTFQADTVDAYRGAVVFEIGKRWLEY